MRIPKVTVTIIVFCLLVLTPKFAKAEWFSDFFVGYAYTQDDNSSSFSNGIYLTEKIDYDNAFVLGYRVGHYFERLPFLGVALEASYFEPSPDLDTEDADLKVLPVSALLFLRLPLFASAEYPKGKFQPYLGIGPGLFISSYKSGQFDDTSIDLGLDVKTGLAVMFAHNFAFFLEYRYSYFEFEFDDHIGGIRNSFEGDLTTHYGLIGLSYRF
ncbi:MAG: porin family protein [Desulfobacterales bacterium]|nr:porin family protein [Desulfobacterales bacterium]